MPVMVIWMVFGRTWVNGSFFVEVKQGRRDVLHGAKVLVTGFKR